MDGESDIIKMGTIIFNPIIDTTSGKLIKSEINDCGKDKFNPWIISATM